MKTVIHDLTSFKAKFTSAIQEVDSIRSLETLQFSYLGKKGIIKDLFSEMKVLPDKERVAYAQQLYVVSPKRTDTGEKRREAFSHFELAEKYDFSVVSALITA